jgi:filamentous hemagglutinin
LGTVSAVGNVTGTYFIGNGAFLTGIASGNNNYSNANVAAYLPTYTGNLVSLTGPVITTGNITGGNVSSVGNVTANNLIANSRIKIGLANIYTTNFDPAVLQIQSEVVEFSGQIIAISDISGNNISAGGNVTGSNIYTNGIVSATGNIYAANFVGNVTGNITVPGVTTQILFNDGGLAGANAGLTFNKATQVLSVTGNIQSGNLRTAGLISATGNIAGQYFVGNGALLTGIVATAGAAITNGNSNVVVSGNGNVTVSVTGVANVTTVATTGLYVAGEVSATGNVTGNYIIGNGALLTGLAATYGNANVANYLPTYSGNLPSLTGLVSTTGNISGNYVLGNGALLTGVITSVANINNGTSNVTVVSSGGNITVGVGGTGNVAVFATTGEYVTGVVSASGNITGSNLVTSGLATITGNVDAGNLQTTGLITSTGNITGGNVLTGGVISATGNVTGNYFIGNGSQLTGVAASSVNADALIGNTLSANVLYSSLTTVGNLANLSVVGNAISGNLLTGGLISATGNINVGNINTVGLASVTGNITGGNLLTGGLISATGNIDVGNIRTAGIASVTGNITSGNILTGGLVSATANIVGGNITTAGLISATGNVDAGNINTVGFASVTGNITGGNLSTSGLITASGNISGNNIFATTLVSVTGNLIAANVNTSAIRPTSGELTITTAAGNLNLQPAGNIVLANTIINSLAYPLQDTDAASKLYVDNMVSTGIAYHSPVSAATTTDLATATGGSITYAQPNGVANGIGATLTTTGSFNLIDTANVQTIGTRILVQNEGNTVFNGVYTWANTTVIVRSTDADQYGPDSTEQLSINDYFFVQNGTVNKGAAFVVSAPPGTITFGTSGITFSQFSSSQTYTANTNAGISLIGTQFNTKVDNDTTAFDGSGNIIVKASANLTTPNIGAATGTSLSLTGNAISGNVLTGGLISATGNITGGNLSISGNISGANVISGTTISATANVIGGNITTVGEVSATANIIGGNLTTGGVISATSTITSAANITGGNILTAGIVSATGNITGDYILGNGLQLTGILGSNVNMGTNTAGTLVSNAVTLTTTTTVTNGIALLNQVLGKLVPPAPPNFPGANTITLSGIATYRMANITQVDNTPGANKAVAAGTSVANVLRVATYATNTIANVGPGDAGTITAVRNGSNVGNVTLNTGASPSGNGTYGSNLVISNNFDYNSANANITAGFWYVFSARVSGASAPPGWNEVYIADSSTGNTNTTVWYYDNSSPSTPAFSSTTMTPPGSANVLYSSTIPHYTNNNNFTIAFTVANISGNTYPTANTLASGSSAVHLRHHNY